MIKKYKKCSFVLTQLKRFFRENGVKYNNWGTNSIHTTQDNPVFPALLIKFEDYREIPQRITFRAQYPGYTRFGSEVSVTVNTADDLLAKIYRYAEPLEYPRPVIFPKTA